MFNIMVINKLMLLMFFTCVWSMLEEDYDSLPVLPESMEKTRDARSGCMCRVYEMLEFVTCFDTRRCVKYPKDIFINVPGLVLQSTNIHVLNKNDLIQHQILKNFNLESNENLYRIEPGAFNNMSNIVNLTISYNKNLMYLEIYTFKGLTNLKTLTLEKNGFHALKDFTYSITHGLLPVLQRLTITAMPFENVTADDFILQNMTLTHFYLTTCQIKSINATPFVELRQLRTLDLSENVMDPNNLANLLEIILDHGVPLKVLRLGNMGFKELPYNVLNAIAKSNITDLLLTKNQLEIIEKFPKMPNIERLIIEHAVALNVTSKAFDYMPNLKYLHLSGNRFSDIPNAILLPNLEYLDISNCKKYFSLEGTNFTNMTRLKYLNLSGNNIRKISASSFKGLINLEVLNLQDTKLFFANSSAFYPLHNLNHLNIADNPFRDIQRGLFNGLWQLETLHMGNSVLQNISKYSYMFKNLTSLKHLNLERNQITALPADVLRPLINLKSLNLSNNDMMAWEEQMFQNNPNVRMLILNSNKLKEATYAMLNDFMQLEHINMNNNPFMCKCPDINVLYDAYSKSTYNHVIKLFGMANITCGYPQIWNNRKIIEFLSQIEYNEDEECKEAMPFVAPLVIIAVTIAVLSIAGYVYRWHIQYWLFLTKLYLSRSGRVTYSDSNKTVMQYEYDAFVSYSNEDQEFVIKLVTALEKNNPFYKLCVYERDFQIGTVISETVLESVAKSRKTLLIVSEAYIKSTWCRWEVQVAENKRLFYEKENGECVNDSLVIIKLGEISTKNLSPILKYLMKTRVYLEWDNDARKQRIFWCKLRNSLAENSNFY